jgi:hypothetical protein
MAAVRAHSGPLGGPIEQLRTSTRPLKPGGAQAKLHRTHPMQMPVRKQRGDMKKELSAAACPLHDARHMTQTHLRSACGPPLQLAMPSY